MKNFIFFLILLVPVFSYSIDDDLIEEQDSFSVWISLEPQLGAIDRKLFATMGSSMGISIHGFSLGAGLHGSYLFDGKTATLGADLINIIYGGAIIGYNTPTLDGLVGMRFHVLLGYATLANDVMKSGHFTVAPSVYLDFHLMENFVLSAGFTYRYFHNADRAYGFSKPENTLAAIIGLSWMSD
ncbi:MAG: hypothetical protein ACRCV0_05150 [Brevinema sp.]